MLTLTTAFFCSFAALAGGFIDAISGGGGLLTIPALLLCGMPPHIALGTNKVSALCGTTIALINFARNRLVLWKLACFGIIFSLAGSWLGSIIALKASPEALAKIIIFLLPVGMAATIMPSKKKQGESAETFELSGAKFWILLPIVCFAIGCYDGFFGPATGSFLILGLHWVLGVNLLQASATAKAFNLASNFSAAVAFVWHGAVFWPLALLMAAFLMLGNWLGSRCAIKLGAKAVRRFLVVSLFLLLGTLVWEYFLTGQRP